MKLGLAIAAVIALLAGIGWWQWSRAADLSERLGEATAKIEALARAEAQHAATVEQLQAQAQAAAALDRELQEQEGADAPLGGYLAAGAGRVWP